MLAGLLNMTMLSHILSLGSLMGYSVVAACVMTLLWDDSQVSKRMEGIVHYCDCLLWFCCWNSIPL
ncbi:hypothetical protein HanHA300_Chr04g0148311 [Helianthus annuus]|nr:hypothetical protein HanHA300_Chr04g0148311 [Helianthus annuus]KAJ0598068.1 hypothetical protein HanHA89_Chr04g0161701 [Helianthus annuus]